MDFIVCHMIVTKEKLCGDKKNATFFRSGEGNALKWVDEINHGINEICFSKKRSDGYERGSNSMVCTIYYSFSLFCKLMMRSKKSQLNEIE